MHAFGLRYASERAWDSVCPKCTSNNRVLRTPWFDASCVDGDRAPRLLALHWDLDDFQPLIGHLLTPVSVQLDEARRNAAELNTSYGNVHYRLIALVLFDGRHYIPVGRSSSLNRRVFDANEWICWDGNKSSGIGCVLSEAPSGSGVLCSRDRQMTWIGFNATIAIYCRI